MNYAEQIEKNWSKIPFVALLTTQSLIKQAVEVQNNMISFRANMICDKTIKEAVIRQTLLNAQINQREQTAIMNHCVDLLNKMGACNE